MISPRPHRPRRLGAAALTAVAAFAVAMPGSASASAPPSAMPGSQGVEGMSERELRDFETEVLGPTHAAEHARQRRAEQTGLDAPSSVRSSAVAAAAPADPAISGRWGAPFQIPVMAINAVTLPTGKVMWWSYPRNPSQSVGDPDAPNTAQAWLWNPSDGSTTRVDPPLWRDPADNQLKPANIWCSGQSLLADGRVLVTGGNLAYDGDGIDYKGLNKVYTFNPWNETWTEQPDMRHGRWYPSQVLLPDGRTAIMSGFDESGGGYDSTNKEIEIFTPSPNLDGVGTLSLLGTRGGSGKPPDGGLYPHTFVMPSGRVMVAGPDPNDSWFLHDPGVSNVFAWTDFQDTTQRLWGTGVLLPGGPSGSTKVQQLGGSNRQVTPLPTRTTATFDEASPSAGWRSGPQMQIARSHHNTVLLPDGSMVTVGGGVGSRAPQGQYAFDPEQRQIEIYDPATDSWRLGAEQAEARTYHSTAVLLPDGRVISAGDDYNGGIDRDTAEIYEPPYLFKGPRPTIASAPSSVTLGQAFTAGTPNTDIAKAVLVAPAATTHSVDMNQRLVQLTMTERSGAVDLAAPPNGKIAPPGWYMLFLVNDAGVPSIAKWVRLLPSGTPTDGAPPTVSVTAPSNGATVSGASVTVNANASDDVGVTGVQFKLDGQNLGSEDTASPYTTTWNTTQATNGNHTLTAVARDAAGNTTTSTTVTVNVQNVAPPSGLMAAYSFDEGVGVQARDSSGQQNAGAISGASWTTGGRHGGALSFDGVNDLISIQDSNSLDLSTQMTLEAWVRPTTTSGYRTAMIKETSTYLAYALYAGTTNSNRTAVEADRGELFGSAALPLNGWTHLAGTYDGTALRIFHNGTQVSSVTNAQLMPNSSNPLYIGGNVGWGEFFHGLIDDARVYNRALSPAEIQADRDTPVGGAAPPADTTPPTVGVTAPANGATVSGTSVTVNASASDNVGVTGVQFKLDGQNLGSEDTASPYTTTWNTTQATNGNHTLTAVARDAAGNTTTSTTVTVNVQNVTTPPPSGLMAAYSFNDGAGVQALDSSGNANTGLISGASWTPSGRSGGALSFDGVNDRVTVPDANSLDMVRNLTLEAWVRPTTTSGYRTAMIKETASYLSYALYAGTSNSNRPAFEANRGELYGTAALALNTWSHVAGTYDGTTMRMYVNGTQVATRTTTQLMSNSSNPLYIGGNVGWGEFFHGLIDDVRVYNRTLSAAEIQRDRDSGVPTGTP